MYSPQVRPELVRKLYKLKKLKHIALTQMVNEAVEEYLNKHESNQEVKEMSIIGRIKSIIEAA